MKDGTDRWHRWLTGVRHGGDAAGRERLLAELLYPIREQVLDKARLRPGDTLLDVGTVTWCAMRKLPGSRKSASNCRSA
jgi:hypothetical protein